MKDVLFFIREVLKYFLGLFIALLAIWWAIGDVSKSTIILGENQKKHNAIVVHSGQSSTSIDKVGSYVDLKSKNRLPLNVKMMSKEEIERRFKDVIQANPTPAETFFLYFKRDGKELAEGSEEIFLKAIESIEHRSPCLVDVIGHTDSFGTEESNLLLVLQRSEYVTKLLLEEGLNPSILSMQLF